MTPNEALSINHGEQVINHETQAINNTAWIMENGT